MCVWEWGEYTHTHTTMTEEKVVLTSCCVHMHIHVYIIYTYIHTPKRGREGGGLGGERDMSTLSGESPKTCVHVVCVRGILSGGGGRGGGERRHLHIITRHPKHFCFFCMYMCVCVSGNAHTHSIQRETAL